jgi:PST family polysaccharide transporter
MKPLFTYQLLGDFFKIGSWLLAYLMIAKALAKTFIITEILFAIS